MSSLGTRSPSKSYKELLKINTPLSNSGIDLVLRDVEDGSGTVTPLQLATNKIAFHGKQWPVANGAPGTVLQVSADPSKLEWAPVVTAPPVDTMQVTTSMFPGIISSAVGTIRWYPGKAVIVRSIFLSISTAPTYDLSIDVIKTGVSIFGSAAKPTIAATKHKTAIIPLSVTMTADDYLTVDILGGDGADLVVRFEYQ